MAKEPVLAPKITTSFGEPHDHGTPEVASVEPVVQEVVEEIE
jgi:hypothetical protein